jgi:hypothetical protein
MRLIRSCPRQAHDGDTARLLTSTHIDTNGTRYEAGTVYEPAPAGTHEANITVDGQPVTIRR